ncbi:PAS domain-containing protein [Halomicronema sp. CCY15110]|uniref:PAS domain-containing protein n=1 Tax=Halomicronema sp. CCY15110 TaxID=2767773 RepID=UPI00194F48ED|nr:PAS domain-containing protein [Halomicronema sp. CCY15110]
MGISLRSLLVIPFVIQVIGVTSVVGYLSYRSCQRIVEELATQLLNETGNLIAQNLDRYLLAAASQNQSHLAALNSGAISLDDLDQLHRYLTLELLVTENATTFLLGTEAGDLRASHRVTAQDYEVNTRLTPAEMPIEMVILDPSQSPNTDLYSVDAEGNQGRYLESIQGLEVHTRPWYRQAAETGVPGWSEIFQIGSTDHLAISAFAPIYTDAQQLLGVFAVNVSLRQLDDFLADLAFVKSGQAFVMQANGLMVANSTTAPSYIAVQPPRNSSPGQSPPLAMPQNVEFQRLTAAESENPVTRAAFHAIQASVDSTAPLQTSLDLSMQVAGDRYYTHATPYCNDCGLDWVIVTTVPESAFVGTLWGHMRPAIAWSGFTLLAAIGFGIWLTRRITRPLQQLNKATLAYADGRPEVVTTPTLVKEVESLRLAFLEMMAKTDAQQHEIQQFHTNYQQSLKAEIAHHTAELSTTTAQLCEAQRIAKVGSWEFEVASGQLSWSAEMFQIMGRDPALGVPKVEDAYALVTPPGEEPLRAAVAQALTAGVPYELEQMIIQPTGERRYVLNRGEVQRDEQGNIVRLVGTTADITERKTAELALATSEERRRLALELTNTGSWEFEVDTGLATWSDSHYRLMGLVPQSVPANYEVWRDLVYPDDLAAAEAAFQTAIDQHTLLSVEYRVVHPEGAVRWVLTQGQAIYAADGTPQRMVGVMLDISDRKQLELALQASESQLSSVLDSARATIVRLRLFPDHRFEFIYLSPNCEHLYGFSAAALMADPYLWQGCVEPADWPTLIVAFATPLPKQMTAPQQFVKTYRYRYPHGSLQYILAHLSVQWNGSGYWDCTIVDADITELKRTEETLQLLSQELQVWRDRYEIAITTGRQVVFEYDFSRQTYTFSQNTSEMFGYDPVDLPETMEDSLARVHPDDVQALAAAIQAAQTAPPHAYCLEIRIRCQDGTYLWVEDQARIQLDAAGQPVKIIGSLKDISDRKQAEMERDIVMEQLRQSGENYLAILQHQTELITRFKPDGTVIFVNDAFCEYYGVHKTDMLGQTYHPFIYSADQPAIDACLARLSPKHPYSTVEHRVFVRGEVRWMQWTNRAIYDAQEHLIEMQSVGRDIHDLKQVEAALRESQAQYQRLVDDIGDRFVVFSHTGELGILTYVSDGIQSVFGLQRQDVIGKTWQTAVDWCSKSVALALTELQALLHGSVDFQEFEMEFTHPDGARRTVRVSQHPVRDAAGELLEIEGIVEDISDYKQAEIELQLLNAQLEELATTDSLTKVANRRQFLIALAQEWSRHQREGLPLTIMMLDIDHFKAYNDTYGHPAGDRCLTQIAEVLKQNMQRPGDLVARYGGEEFIMLLPNTHQVGAVTIVQHIQTQIAEQAIPHAASPTGPHITVSLGIAVVPRPTAMDDMTAIEIADKMLYAAKRYRNIYQLKVVNHPSEE